ncbi:toxin glutamine deamidase domain-containing protein, partial [Streptomyces sp. NPDC048290]|uniref:toxin glutamine deamidase domain-containing protein n=1 Tax=Streptomyces sp. NPDC048290 TaxID=3155811 RepID=UPI003412F079
NNATSDENSPLYGDDPGRVWAIVLDADGNQKAPQLTDTEWKQFRDAANALEFLTVSSSDPAQMPTRRKPVLTDTSDLIEPLRTSSDRSSGSSDGRIPDLDTRQRQLTQYLSPPTLVKLSAESGYLHQHITKMANQQLTKLRMITGQPTHLTAEMLTYKAIAHQKVEDAVNKALVARGEPRDHRSAQEVRDQYHEMVENHFSEHGQVVRSQDTHNVLPWLHRDVLPPIAGTVHKVLDWDAVHDQLNEQIQNGLGRQIMTAGHDLATVADRAHYILENVLEQEQGTDGIAMDVIVNAAMFETWAANEAYTNFYNKVQIWLSARNLHPATAGAMAQALLPRFYTHFTQSLLEGTFSSPQSLLASDRYDRANQVLEELDTKTDQDLALIGDILNDVSRAVSEAVQQLTVTGRQVPAATVEQVRTDLRTRAMELLKEHTPEDASGAGSSLAWKQFRRDFSKAIPGEITAVLNSFLPPAPRTLMVMNPDSTTSESTTPERTTPEPTTPQSGFLQPTVPTPTTLTATDNTETHTDPDDAPPQIPPRPAPGTQGVEPRPTAHSRLESYLNSYVPLTDEDGNDNTSLRQSAHAILDRLFDVGEPKPRIKHALELARTYEAAVKAATTTAENLAAGVKRTLTHDMSEQEMQKAVGLDHGALVRTVADNLFMGDPRSLDDPKAGNRLTSEVTKETNRALKVGASMVRAERLIDTAIEAVVTDRTAQNLPVDRGLVDGFRQDLTTQTRDALDDAYRKATAKTSMKPLPARLRQIEATYLEDVVKPRLGDLDSLLDAPVRGVNDLVTQFDKNETAQRIIPVSALFKDDGTRAFENPQQWLDRAFGPEAPIDLVRSNFDDNCVIAALAFYATFNAATKADIRGFDSTSLANKDWSHATIAQNALNAAASTMGVGEPALKKVAQQIKDLGPGASAIVFVSRTPGNPEGHAYNLVNHDGTLIAVDVPHKKITEGGFPSDAKDPGPVWALMFDAEGEQSNPPQLTDAEWAELRNTPTAVLFKTTHHDGGDIPGTSHDPNHPTQHNPTAHQPTPHPTGPVHQPTGPAHHPTQPHTNSNRHSTVSQGPLTVPELPDRHDPLETPSQEQNDPFLRGAMGVATGALKPDLPAAEITKLKNRELVYGDFTEGTAGAAVRDALSKRLQSLGATTLELKQLSAVEEFVKLRTGLLRGAGRDFDIKVGSRVFTARITAQLDLKQAEVLTPSDKTVTTKPKSTTTSVSD